MLKAKITHFELRIMYKGMHVSLLRAVSLKTYESFETYYLKMTKVMKIHLTP